MILHVTLAYFLNKILINLIIKIALTINPKLNNYKTRVFFSGLANNERTKV